MSLQVWLPLTESLKNNGVAPLTFGAAQSSGITTTADGKIGRAYACTSVSCGGIISNTTLQLGSKLSMFCWVKMIDYTQTDTGSSLNGLVTNHNHSTPSGFGLTLRNTGSAFYVSLSTGTGTNSLGGGRTYSHIHGTTPFYINEWHHVGFTYDGAIIRLYLDGKEETIALQGTTTGVKGYSHIETNKNPANLIGVFRWSTTYDAYCPYCCLNDVRIYNHCLSLKEIHEISKAKVLHYQLKSNRPTVTNLKQDTHTNTYSIFHIYNNYGTSNITYTVTKLSNEQFMGSPIYRLTMTPITDSGLSNIKSGLWDTGVAQDGNPTFKANTKYCYWLYWRPISDTGVIVGGTASNIGGWAEIPSHYYKNGWYRCGQYRNGSVTTDKTDSIFTSFYFANAVLNKPVIIDFAAPHLIEGYSQIIETDGYMLSSPYTTTEFDVSGNEHNGTIVGTILKEQNNGSVGRFDGAYKFTGAEYIRAHQSAKVKDAITVNIWGYMDDWSQYSSVNSGMRLASCTDSGGWNFEPSGGMQFSVGTGTSSNTYKSVKDSTALSSLSSGWHMFTGTYDGKNVKIYVDGQLKGTNAAYSTKTPIFYNSTNTIFVGAEATTSNTTPESSYRFVGKLSDFRIYGTALSNEDILELYQSAGVIDNKNNVYCYEFNEVDI